MGNSGSKVLLETQNVMINGFAAQTAQLTTEEQTLLPLLVESLKKKVGEEKAVTSKDIEAAFAKIGKKVSGPRVRKLINHIRINGLVELLCATSKGYYVARTNVEIESYLEGLKSRIEAQQAVYDMVKAQYDMRLTSLTKNQ